MKMFLNDAFVEIFSPSRGYISLYFDHSRSFLFNFLFPQAFHARSWNFLSSSLDDYFCAYVNVAFGEIKFTFRWINQLERYNVSRRRFNNSHWLRGWRKVFFRVASGGKNFNQILILLSLTLKDCKSESPYENYVYSSLKFFNNTQQHGSKEVWTRFEFVLASIRKQKRWQWTP